MFVMAGFTSDLEAHLLDMFYNTVGTIPDVSLTELWIKPTKVTPPSRTSPGQLATEIPAVQIKGGGAGADYTWTITTGTAVTPTVAAADAAIVGGVATADVQINGFNVYNGSPDTQGTPTRVAWDKFTFAQSVLANNAPSIPTGTFQLDEASGVGGWSRDYEAYLLDLVLNSTATITAIPVTQLWLQPFSTAPTAASPGTALGGAASAVQIKGGTGATEIPWTVTAGTSGATEATATKQMVTGAVTGNANGVGIYNGDPAGSPSYVAWSVYAAPVSLTAEGLTIPIGNSKHSVNSTAE